MKLKSIIFSLLGSSLLLASCAESDEVLKKQVKEMAEMSELGTIEATVKKVVKVSDKDWYKIGDRSILFRCTAYLKSGLDMSKMTEEDIVIDRKENSIKVTLPAPQLLSLDMPSEETDLAYSHVSLLRSDFSVEDRNEILRQGEEDIRSDYANLGIVEETKASASELFTALLTQAGYDTVTIEFKENE